MNFAGLAERLAHIRGEVARRQAAGGWTHPVTIVAVTKGFGPDAVAAARAAGLPDVGEKEQKSGCPLAEAPALLRRVAALDALALEGLMAMAPLTDDAEVQRTTFRGLRQLRDAMQEEGLWVPTLSMGMSGDFATAVEEGATVIRLGTALFGPRTT